MYFEHDRYRLLRRSVHGEDVEIPKVTNH